MQVSFAHGDDPFYRTLRKRVQAYFEETGQSPFANHRFYLKGLLYAVVYLGAYGMLLASGGQSAPFFVGYALMGATAILIGLNLGHDAAHGAISRKKWVNALFMQVFDLMGANSFMWRNRHVFAHHPYPNVIGQDSDIQQVPFVRIFPNDRILPMHRYQHLYMPLLYLLYTSHWILRRDFRDFLVNEAGAFKGKKIPGRQVWALIGYKAFFAAYTVVLPAWVLPVGWGKIGAGFLLMNVCASLVVAIALISAHVGEDAVFPTPDEAGRMPDSWAVHQLVTTSDFATRNPVINALFGGFNHHVIHHLFPRICHIHYPALTRILRETAAEFDLPYNHEPRLTQAMISHWRLLKKQGPAVFHSLEI